MSQLMGSSLNFLLRTPLSIPLNDTVRVQYAPQELFGVKYNADTELNLQW
jgi:hypothetical protein